MLSVLLCCGVLLIASVAPLPYLVKTTHKGPSNGGNFRYYEAQNVYKSSSKEYPVFLQSNIGLGEGNSIHGITQLSAMSNDLSYTISNVRVFVSVPNAKLHSYTMYDNRTYNKIRYADEIVDSFTYKFNQSVTKEKSLLGFIFSGADLSDSSTLSLEVKYDINVGIKTLKDQVIKQEMDSLSYKIDGN